MATITEYIAKLDKSEQAQFERLRTIVKGAVPEFEETISWGMPTFKYKKKFLIHFAAFKDHMSLFPGALGAIEEKLKDYKTSKGTIQFTAEHPVPEAIIKELLHRRMKDIDESTTE